MTRPAEAEGFDPGPSTLGQGLTLAVGLAAALSLAPVVPAVLVGALGAVIQTGGLRVRSERIVGAGATALVAGLLVGGVSGTPPELLVIAAATTLVAWDVADNTRSVGEQLGRNARTERLELAHAAASLSVASIAAAAVYTVFRLSGGGAPLVAVVLLLIGATLIVAALR